MAIEPNPRPNTSPEDREVLERVYRDQMREYQQEYQPAVSRLDKLTAEYVTVQNERLDALREVALLDGKMDALRAVAARDGITDLG